MRLLVVGDAMLDRDVLGVVERVAPDAPVALSVAGVSQDQAAVERALA